MMQFLGKEALWIAIDLISHCALTMLLNALEEGWVVCPLTEGCWTFDTWKATRSSVKLKFLEFHPSSLLSLRELITMHHKNSPFSLTVALFWLNFDPILSLLLLKLASILALFGLILALFCPKSNLCTYFVVKPILRGFFRFLEFHPSSLLSLTQLITIHCREKPVI